MFDLKGKVALITGATGGIGHAMVKKFHASGATVVISGTRENVLQEIAHELKDRVIVKAANLANSDEVVNLYKFAEEAAGQVDILVCNAGITKDNLVLRMSEDEWDSIINVNLKSAFLLNREALKAMSKRRYGRIINITSIVGVTGNFGQANYVASKAGLIGLTKTIALEGATRGITANCIAPGFIASPMTNKLNEAIQEKILTKIPMNRQGEPDDVANSCLFLASESASYITGHTLHVNGGMYMM